MNNTFTIILTLSLFYAGFWMFNHLNAWLGFAILITAVVVFFKNFKLNKS